MYLISIHTWIYEQHIFARLSHVLFELQIPNSQNKMPQDGEISFIHRTMIVFYKVSLPIMTQQLCVVISFERETILIKYRLPTHRVKVVPNLMFLVTNWNSNCFRILSSLKSNNSQESFHSKKQSEYYVHDEMIRDSIVSTLHVFLWAFERFFI